MSTTNNRPADNELILPRVKLSPKGYDNHAAVIDIEEPLFVSRDKPPKRRDAEETVRIARNAFATGRTKDVEFRRKQLKNLMRMLEENEKRFVEALAFDVGKHKQEAVAYEVDYTINDVRGMLHRLDEYARPGTPKKDLVNLMDGMYVYKDPYGVVLVIGAWNYPIQLMFAPVVGAIAAGNCVIIKPSEVASACASLIAELSPNYLDPACYQVYLGGVEETTELLKERFDYIFYTGSTIVGKIVHQAASKYLTPTTLELGGKSPVYMDDTVNIEIATRRILWGKCMNAGQTCIAPDYLLCSKLVQERFVTTAQKFQGDKHEAYVRLTMSQHCRTVKEKRTGIARPSRDGSIAFAEGFNFKLAPAQVDVTSLAIHVFQATSGYGRDKLIGKCVLGSYMFARGKALIQWNTAIANPMEACQQWHTLCE